MIKRVDSPQALAKADWLDYNPTRSGRGSARLERTVRVREVPSSNLGAPTSWIRIKISFGLAEGDFDFNYSGMHSKISHLCVHN